MWITLALRFGVTYLGTQGTVDSITRTTSALGRNGAAAKPRFIGWLVAKLMSRASFCTTGSANSCASADNSSNAARVRPALDVTISGNSAFARRLATSSIARADGAGADDP